MLGFMISATVGASRPTAFATALRTIRMSFTQIGVCPNSAKNTSTIPSPSRVNGAR